MFTRYWKLFACLFLVLALCGVFCPVILHRLHAEGTKGASAANQPATLAEARQQYWDRIKRQYGETYAVSDTNKANMNLMKWMYNSGWYDRCIEQCDEILQRWPDARLSVFDATAKKAWALAKLDRFREAYDHLNTLEQRYKDDNTLILGAPYDFMVRLNVMLTKTDLLYEQGKYRESAELALQTIEMYRHPNNQAVAKFKQENAVQCEQEMHLDWPRKAADAYFQAGDYDAASAQYEGMLAYLNKAPQRNDPKDRMYFMRMSLQPQLEYIIPVEIAQCRMREQRYADALKIYEEVQRYLADTKRLQETFCKPEVSQSGYTLKYDETAAAYYMQVDLPLRMAECLIKLKEKARAQQAVNIAEKQLAANPLFLTEAEKVLKARGESILHQDVHAKWMQEIQTVTLPALKKDISKLK